MSRSIASRVLMTDLYQLTMAAGYFHRGMSEVIASTEMFFRRLPEERRYLVAMGLSDVVDDLLALRFEEEDLTFLASVPSLTAAMTPAFSDYLRRFRFTGDLDAVAEGSLVFANEPIVTLRAPIIEAQLVETLLLSTLNYQTMIASKASRIVDAAEGRAVYEFGTRRTHPEAALDAARVACAAGFSGTSNVEAGRRYGLPVLGTAAHMWTMAHRSEEEAFSGYLEVFPQHTTLLIDTSDTEVGARRAARIGKERLRGVRIDSGDLVSLSRSVRAVLDAEGAPGAKIVVSGDLNEHSIEALVSSGAPIDAFGVGTELVCSVDAPSLSGVYKVVSLTEGGATRPICKASSGKGTLPGEHQVFRERDAGGFYAGDHVVLRGELPPTSDALPLLIPTIRRGERVQAREDLGGLRSRIAAERGRLSPELRARTGPHSPYPVHLSPALVGLRNSVVSAHGKGDPS